MLDRLSLRRGWGSQTYIRNLVFVGVLEYSPQHVHRRLRLDGNPGGHIVRMDILDHLFGIRPLRDVLGRILRRCGCHGGFIVEAVEVAAGLLEVFDPLLGLPHVFCKLARSHCDN